MNIRIGVGRRLDFRRLRLRLLFADDTSTPTATSPTPPDSSATTVSTQARPAAVEVSRECLPGTPSSDGDWCTGGERVTLTAHVVEHLKAR